jgi:hypothetical protein
MKETFAMGDDRIKVMYSAPLPEERSHEAFLPRWRQHGRLAMGLPMWQHMSRYKQCDVLTAGECGLTPAHLESMSVDAYGGVGMIWFRDAAALAAATSDADVPVMQRDEVEAFGRELGTNLVPTGEHVLFDHGGSAITLVGAVHRRQGLEREKFSDQWREFGAVLAATPDVAGHARKYIQNHTIGAAPWCDGFVELGFGSADELTAFMEAFRATEGFVEREGTFVDYERLDLLLTAETVLYDEAPAPGAREAVASVVSS